jgi:2'-5' RNA ligase
MMAFAVITYFNPTAEAEVQSLWALLSEKQISSVIATMGIRPHLSLACIENLDAQQVCAMLKTFAQSVSPLTIKFGAVGTFPTEQGVVYLAPVVTLELLQLHEEFRVRLADLGFSSHEYYRPGNWIPHCTVAINLPPESVPAAVSVCRRSDVFHAVQLVEIALVEYLPVREICVHPFGG